MDEVDSPLIDNVKSFAAGGFGGVCAVLTGHPFDLVKVRLQTGMYNSAITCVKDTVKNDGLLGLYRGVMPPLLGVTPMFAVSFWGYDLGKRVVSSATGRSPEQFSIADTSAAGFFSAIPTTVVAAPVERVKVVMQVQDSKDSSMLKTLKEIYKKGGITSVYKGTVATLCRDGPGSAVYFATYEYLKEKLSSKDSDSLSLGAICTAGGFAGVAMWLVVFPVDTIKSLQQSSPNKVSMAQAYKQIMSTKGVAGFFPGVGPALARSFPANAATFLGVELARKFLDSVI
ncbi:hypothetical protein DIURU_005784 [Diutina rugosa]|uniref:Mitochondrial thiamine pyrophosphate carrier 1 n=1 Tax=Diutina rugosa TaxID=5481 RepID=A0A642UBW4_DIURU|nr:uncharacterized protein DIURU_005784 [Diutina rugosa]KAA8896412.1 hypothetical protein DIURU_005784 [Diutina rugosa]